MLFCTFTPFTHVLDQFEVYHDVMQAFARAFRVITFDARGTGMSEREVDSVSRDTHLADAEAVLDAASVDQAIVNVDGTSMLATSTALRLAITQPNRVSHVVLEAPFINVRDLLDTPFGRTGLALAELDWAVYTKALFRILLESSSLEMIDSFVALADTWVEPAVGVKYIREWEVVDLTSLLRQVRQPTLVTRNHPCFVPVRSCQRVAAKIPGARFRQYSDPTYAEIARLIVDFVGLPNPSGYPAAERDIGTRFGPGHGMTAILFADIADSTALTERLGDAAFRAKARDLDSALRTVIREHAGTAIEGKLLGDGVLAVFTSARQAIEAALACAGAGKDAALPLHLGLHAGDVIREDNNVYGGAVNIAARISGLSAPGEVLVSETVRSLARTSAGVRFEDRGEQALKGVGEPLRIWAVRPR
jgi:class 3 adenylate cyclase/pimeloyl-ACP methyl ester carboxylesterase